METTIGILGGLLVALIIAYWQFTKSVAGYRVKKVVRATREIIEEIQSTDSYTGRPPSSK